MTCKYIIYDKGCIYGKSGKRDSKEKKKNGRERRGKALETREW